MKLLGTTLVTFLALLSLSEAAKMLHNPLRIRVNSDLIRGIFHKRDQDLLNVLQDLPLGAFPQAGIDALSVSLEPVSGAVEDFNYHLSLDQNKFLGLESDNMRFTGKGSLSHNGGAAEPFEVEGLLESFRASFELLDAAAEKGKGKLDFKGLDIKVREGTLRVKSSDPHFAEHGHTAEVKAWLERSLAAAIHGLSKEVTAGNQEVINKLPVLSLGPLVGLYFAAFGADKIQFTDQFIEYEFSPVSMKLVRPQNLHEEFLKEIETDFAPQEDHEDPSAMQIILDQNLINGALGQFLKIEKAYSLRDLLNVDPRLAVMKQLLTTTSVGMLVPSFKEEYGENRPINLVLTASHEFMTGGLGDDVTPTGIQLEANGNFQVTLNVGAQLIVENKQGVQEEARAVYCQLALKGKMFVADAQHENRTFVVLPKSLQMPVFKVMNSAAEEQFLEQMLVQSMVGFQLENLKKAFQPFVIPLKTFKNPPESQCLGFNLTNVMVKVNKGYLQVNGNYIRIAPEQVDTAFCQAFEERVAQSPYEILKKIQESPLFDNPMAGKLFESAKKELADDDSEKIDL